MFSSLSIRCEVIDQSQLLSLSSTPLEILARMGVESYKAGDYEKAIEIFTVIRQRYDESLPEKSQKQFARYFLYQGLSLYEKGAYSQSLEALLRARRIAENHGWNDLRAETLAGIGNIHASNYDYPTAISFYRHALSLVEPLPVDSMKNLKASVLNNLTGAYSILQNLDSARIYCRRFELIGDMPDKRHSYDVSLTKALVEDAANNYKSALDLYRKSVNIASSHDLDPIYAAAVYSCMSGTFEKMGKIDSAISYMHNAADVALQEGYLNEHIGSLRDLSRLYEKSGNRRIAIIYKSRYLELADSIRFSEEKDKLHSNEMLYALDSNANTIRGLNAIRTMQWRWLMALSSILLIVLILLIILFKQKKALSQAWSSLYERNLRQIKEEENFRSTIKELESKLSLFTQQPSDSGKQEVDNVDSVINQRSSIDSRSLAMNNQLKEDLASKIRELTEHSDYFYKSDFNLTQLAEILNSNTRYVSEAVNDVIGKSFRDLMNECRIKRAMEMLGDNENYGNLTIKAIGESVGYKSSSTFISVFTRMTGLKPSVYQKLAKENKT